MTGSSGQESGIVDWGWAGTALEEGASGDVHAVAELPDRVVLGVIDGVGHGIEAAAAANEAARIVEAFAGESIVDLVQRCHEALHHTRGAVMTLASFDARQSSLTWIAIGNVDGILLRAGGAAGPAREAITPRGGIVGYQLPGLRASEIPVSPGDTLILATDGIRSGFGDGLSLQAAPQKLAESILERHARGNDDALVLVARYVGARP